MIAPFVDATWLAAHYDEVVVADVRWYLDGRSGREAYVAGHLPGAVFVEMDTALAAPPSDEAGRHPLPAPADFAAAMAAVGIRDGDTVVAYDDAGGIFGARLVWMLRATGHEAALLDGGIAGWAGPLEAGAGRTSSAPETVVFTVADWPAERVVGIDDVVSSAAGAAGAVVIDARASERYQGEPDELDPRAGHIPGARSFPCRENLDPSGRLLATAQLRGRAAEVGIGEGTAVISYCGSGVTACHNLLVIEHAGLGLGKLFPGSWSQWSRDPERMVEVGPDAG